MCQEERIRAKIRQKFRRARDVDNLFTTFLPHIPFLFMQVQDEICREKLTIKCPKKKKQGDSKLSQVLTL